MTLAAAGLACALASPLSTAASAPPPIASLFIDNYTVSPGYATDHALWAVGQDLRTCAITDTVCNWVYKSTDGGTTWSSITVPALENPYQIILPSASPTDPTVFLGAGDATANILRSDDGGSAWQKTGPYLAEYSISAQPGQPAGDDRLVVDGGNAFQTYDEATGKITLGPSVPPGIVTVWSAGFVDDNTFFAAATTAAEEAELGPYAAGATAEPPNDLLRCSLAACTDLGPLLPHSDTQIAVSPDYATDHTFAVWEGNQIDVTRDGGATFSGVMKLLPGWGPWGVTFTGDTASGPQLVVSTRSQTLQGSSFPSWVSSIVFSSGGPIVTSHDTTGVGTLFHLTSTPDGHLWSTLSPDAAADNGGPRCSADVGATWSTHC